jgi:hypothetical protein
VGWGGRRIDVEKRWLLEVLVVKFSDTKDVVDLLPQNLEKGNNVSRWHLAQVTRQENFASVFKGTCKWQSRNAMWTIMVKKIGYHHAREIVISQNGIYLVDQHLIHIYL